MHMCSCSVCCSVIMVYESHGLHRAAQLPPMEPATAICHNYSDNYTHTHTVIFVLCIYLFCCSMKLYSQGCLIILIECTPPDIYSYIINTRNNRIPHWLDWLPGFLSPLSNVSLISLSISLSLHLLWSPFFSRWLFALHLLQFSLWVLGN